MKKRIAILVGGSDLFSGLRGISTGTKIIRESISPFFDETLAINYNYFLDFGITLRKLVTRLQREYAPSELFLYGYSKGGELVLQLSRMVEETHAVPLLITVDIANGPWSAKIDRSVPANVKKNINVYQKNSRPPLFSYGLPAYSHNTAAIQNIDLSDKTIRDRQVNHSNIEMLVVQQVIGWLKEESRIRPE